VRSAMGRERCWGQHCDGKLNTKGYTPAKSETRDASRQKIASIENARHAHDCISSIRLIVATQKLFGMRVLRKTRRKFQVAEREPFCARAESAKKLSDALLAFSACDAAAPFVEADAASRP